MTNSSQSNETRQTYPHATEEKESAEISGCRAKLSCLQRLALPGVCVFDGEARFANLRRVCRSQAGELCADVIDDIEIAVGAIVVAQAQIGAHRLIIRRIHLH